MDNDLVTQEKSSNWPIIALAVVALVLVGVAVSVFVVWRRQSVSPVVNQPPVNAITEPVEGGTTEPVETGGTNNGAVGQPVSDIDKFIAENPPVPTPIPENVTLDEVQEMSREEKVASGYPTDQTIRYKWVRLPESGAITKLLLDDIARPPDADNDGLPDAEEAKWGTDVNNEDSDGDGFRDGVEVYGLKTDPLTPNGDPGKSGTSQ